MAHRDKPPYTLWLTLLYLIDELHNFLNEYLKKIRYRTIFSDGMSDPDIRWQQRFSNYLKALNQLKNGVELAEERELTDLEQQGLIQSFEYTHELAWNVMKDYARYQGNTDVAGSRDATREAFSLNLIEDGTNWMEMIKSRNQTSHTYNEEVAKEIVRNILESYYPLFLEFRDVMEEKKNDRYGTEF